MDGKDSVGRRISLLNDDSDSASVAATHSRTHSHSLSLSLSSHSDTRLPSLEPAAFRSRTSSYASSPCLSPQTPQLLRSDSTDSAAMTNTPSPVTPTYSYDDAGHSPRHQSATLPYFSLSQQMPAHYAPPPKGQLVPFPPQPFGHHHVFIRPPGTERQPMPPTNPKTKKNQYPCPLAKTYGCNDYFTTSGHAARHAKKHTGKKDAICPDCKKAFTRKDNMEQHRRTHQNGRNARSAGSKDADDARKKMKPTATRPKPSPIQSSQPPTTSPSLVDPSLPVSPASSYSVAPSESYLVSPYADSIPPSYPEPERYQLNPSVGPDDAHRLHALAFLASGEKRKFEA